MRPDWTRWTVGGASLLLGAGGAALWGWKRRRLAELAAGSELVATDRGQVEVARRGSGEAVLILHGNPGGYDQSILLGEALFGNEMDIIAPSRPGYLRTPLDDTLTFEDQAALLVALLDELDVQEALVVGLSGGGPHALQLAADYPERVSGLVLGGAVTVEYDERLFDTGNPVLDPLLTSTPVLDVRSGVFAALRGVAPDRFVASLHAQLSTLEGDDLDRYVEFVLTSPDHRERVLEFAPTVLPVSARIDGTLHDERLFRDLPHVDYGTIECPTLVVHGEFDAAVPIDHAEYVAEALPEAELVRVEADHLAWVGPDADRAGRAVQRFTESVVAPDGRPNP
ncbi:alpha/beta hydrolase [Salinirubellus salinus]|uniref:Alpha/beta hydrolase n=1 Tax=Salinirubellus salinus TaxID=1364945 RepID=A0A9E7U9S9_9EURY|nr:alpha/beta hydrolase [Salinirubellus salinus]UWM53493.1 alpha/beta hydrolase [Salinirubellus salinus]